MRLSRRETLDMASFAVGWRSVAGGGVAQHEVIEPLDVVEDVSAGVLA